jgi:tripartite-type tricarboxylate transporter receptor subunit TctC
LVAFSDARLAEFKDVPASREFGLAIGDLPNFRSLAMSAATSKDKVKVLVDALSTVLDSAEWKAFCAQTYSCTAANSPLQAKARVQALVDKVVGYREGLSR